MLMQLQNAIGFKVQCGSCFVRVDIYCNRDGHSNSVSQSLVLEPAFTIHVRLLLGFAITQVQERDLHITFTRNSVGFWNVDGKASRAAQTA